MNKFKTTSMLSAIALAVPLSFAHAQMTTTQTTTTQTTTGQNPGTQMTTSGARPGNDIGTRESLPLSPNASNITPNDTRSTIAPTPPEPNVPPNATVQQILQAAQQSLASGQTGTADEAMEQAETNILDRSVLQTQTNYVSTDPLTTQIEQARTALGSGDKAGAQQIINQILAGNSPELSE